MIVSHKKQFIFLAFNKTGSSSIEEALGKYGNPLTHYLLKRKYKRLPANNKYVFKHAAPLSIRQLVGEEVWDQYKTFTFVRNPWDRIVSLYHYQNKINSVRYPRPEKSFEEWLKAGGTGTIRKLVSDYVRDEKGNVIVDFIGRFENIEKDFKKACDMIGIDSELPHANKSARTNYREYYNKETREIVRSIAQSDIEMFDYHF